MSVDRQLQELGVRQGGVLVAHAAFSRVRTASMTPIDVIDALRRVLGPGGTLVMPSMSDDDEQPFDAERTPCLGMGVVADTFWRLPGVLRSDSPHAFAAAGPEAARVTATHPPDIPHGLDSPVGRLWELDGHILLLGVGHDANTTIHLAENLAGVRYGCAKHLMLRRASGIVRLDYFEIDHCCEKFALLDDWLEARSLQSRGTVGAGHARLARSRDVVATALEQLRRDETVFLHGTGECQECNNARLGMVRSHATPSSSFQMPTGARMKAVTPPKR
jgi:aminoglycoside 3-N-acetyltransferase